MKKKSTTIINKPVHTTRTGAVSASVFLNNGKDGSQFPSAIIRRSYKTADGFKDSSSYSSRHLNELATVVANLQNWFQTNYPDSGN